MGPNALTSLGECPVEGALPAVFSRAGGAWEAERASFQQEVCRLAAALSTYGLGAGTCAAVLGAEGNATLRAGLAVIAAGATLVPLDPTLSDDAVRRALASTGAVQAIASNETQLARILALRPELPALELVLLSFAAPSERKPAALLVDAAMTVGSASLDDDPGVLRRALEESQGGTACMLVDAAGETRPVSRAALASLAEVLAQALRLARGTALLAGLPVGGAARLGAALAAHSRGATLLLPDPAERPDSGLDQRPADVVLLDPAGLERLHRAWLEDIDAMSWFGRTATRWALRQAGQDESSQGWKYRIADSLALRGLRDKLGGRIRDLNVLGSRQEGEATGAEAFFASVGLPIRYYTEDVAVSLAR